MPEANTITTQPAFPLYYGDNGFHEFWQDTAGDHCLIRNRNEKVWICVMLGGKPAPADITLNKRVKNKGVFGRSYVLAEKTVEKLIARAFKQYQVTLRLDKSHQWQRTKRGGNMVLLEVSPDAAQ